MRGAPVTAGRTGGFPHHAREIGRWWRYDVRCDGLARGERRIVVSEKGNRVNANRAPEWCASPTTPNHAPNWWSCATTPNHAPNWWSCVGRGFFRAWPLYMQSESDAPNISAPSPDKCDRNRMHADISAPGPDKCIRNRMHAEYIRAWPR